MGDRAEEAGDPKSEGATPLSRVSADREADRRARATGPDERRLLEAWRRLGAEDRDLVVEFAALLARRAEPGA